MSKAKDKKIANYAEWKTSTEDERIQKGWPVQKVDMARHLGVTRKTLYNWDDALEKPLPSNEIEKYRTQLYKRAMKDNAPGSIMELYAKLNNLLIEKKETKVIIVSADDRARREVAADQALQDWQDEQDRLGGLGVEEVSGEEEPETGVPVLSEELCADSGQAEEKNPEVGSLALSAGSN